MAKDEHAEDGEIERSIMEQVKKALDAKKSKKVKEEDDEDEEEKEESKSKKVKKEFGHDGDKKDDDDDEEEEEESKKAKKEASKKAKKEEDDEEEDDEEVESKKSKKESSKKTKKEEDDEEEDEEEVESKKGKKESSKKTKKEEDDEEDDEEEVESKKSKKEDIDVNVQDDVAALCDGEELSEDFKAKAATIFEAAVKSKIAQIRKQIREEGKEEKEAEKQEIIESIDNYLNYATKEWMSENKLAVEQGVRNEVTESFISGLKKLFEEHYIDVPDEKEDVFENLVVEVAELEEKLDEQTEKHMETVKELNTYKAKNIFSEMTNGMVDTDIEKFSELVEDVDYDTDEQYREKLNVIKNSYFKSDKKDNTDTKNTAGTNKPVVDGSSDGNMNSIMAAISKLQKKGGQVN